ncbi:MAG: electron transfer flavoprotein subunit alpha/FixB family protein [Nakamurella sp.]
MSEVLVLAEYNDSGLRKVTNELLAAAARIGTPAAVVVGAPGSATRLASELAAAGAAKVYAAESDASATLLTMPAVLAIEAAAAKSTPAAILLAATEDGREIAGRLAVRLNSAIIADAIDVVVDGADVVATQSIYGGAYSVRSKVTQGVPIVSVRPNSIEGVAPAAAGDIVALDVSLDGVKAATIVASHPEPSGDRPDLSAASIVVSGGRGVGSAESFVVVEALADALGGAVGASRAAVDSGYYPHQFQVGQTGVTVSPQLYIALGISGAIQHRAGMQTSKTIVAVNKDSEAPIFEISDFGVVGDLFDVAPKLTEAVRARKQ